MVSKRLKMLSRPTPDVLAAPTIELRRIVKHFGEHKVLHDVSLSVAAGEVLVLCGPSGSGKSTLLRCINGLEAVDGGEVLIDQKQASGSASRLKRLDPRIGMVFQSFNLFPHLTIAQNLIVAPTLVRKLPRAAALERAKRLLERVGIPEKIDAYPDMLSGGQQQRVAIARALINNPSILLADEPTGNLDTKTSIEVMGIFQRLNRERGITVLLITHEHDIAEYGTRIVTFRDGQVVADRAVTHRRDASEELAALPPAAEAAV